MITYFLQTNCCWIVLYLFYFLVLRRETFFTTNRFFLLGSIVFGLIFPFIDFSHWAILTRDSTASAIAQPFNLTVNQLGYTLEEIVVTADPNVFTSTGTILTAIYLSVVLFLTVRLFYGVHVLWRLKKRSKIEKKHGYKLIKTATLHLPFSFFNGLYWSEKLDLSKADHDRILRHELTHIQQHHSIDIIILEVISILFWFNPVVWFYRKSIRNTHEYLADQNVLVESKKKQYGQLLLRQMQSGIAFSLANNFNHSQLKKRFNMMNQNKSSRLALTKYLWAIPLFVILFLAFKASDVTQNIASIPTMSITNVESSTSAISQVNIPAPLTATVIFSEKETPGDSIYQKVDQMPFYPGCSDISDLEERRDCANDKMLRSIYTQIRYPELARKTGTQGVVVIQFVVDKSGKIKNPKLLRRIGQGCDLEVLRVVQTMPDWDPGIHKGKPVNVYFNLPVKFKLEGDPPKVDESTIPISLNIFPNPTSKDVTVKINAAEGPAKLYISDITGKVLKEIDYKNFSGTGTDSFDLSSFAAKGTLLITVAQGDISKTEQVIIR